MITKLERSMDEHRENFDKEKNLRKHKIEITKLKTIITELKKI